MIPAVRSRTIRASLALTLPLALLAFPFAGCDWFSEPTGEVSVDSLVVSPSSADMFIGDTLQLAVQVFGEGRVDRSVRWYVNGVPGGDFDVGFVESAYAGSAVYVAPKRACLYEPLSVTVRAVAVADSTKWAEALITVTEPPITQARLCWVKFLDFGRIRERPSSVAAGFENDIIVAGQTGAPTWAEGGPEHHAAFGSYGPFGRKRWETELAATRSFIGDIATSPDSTASFFVGSGGQEGILCGAIDNSGSLAMGAPYEPWPASVYRKLSVWNNRLYVSGFDVFLIEADMSCNPVRTLRLREQGRAYGFWVGEGYVLASGDYTDSEGVANSAGFVRKLDWNGDVLWERAYDDAVQLHVVEDAFGVIYVGGMYLGSGSHAYVDFVAALDRDGNELWQTSWDGGVSLGSNMGNWSNDLILNPRGGVVLVIALAEPAGNLNCTSPLECWDFGAWAVSPSGTTLWTIRQDFYGSPWDYATAGVFDSYGDLIIVGSSIVDASHDDEDWVIAKFRVP